MISVSANGSSRADLTGRPKFGLFLKPKFNSVFDRFFFGGGDFVPCPACVFTSSVCPRVMCGTDVRSSM